MPTPGDARVAAARAERSASKSGRSPAPAPASAKGSAGPRGSAARGAAPRPTPASSARRRAGSSGGGGATPGDLRMEAAERAAASARRREEEDAERFAAEEEARHAAEEAAAGEEEEKEEEEVEEEAAAAAPAAAAAAASTPAAAAAAAEEAKPPEGWAIMLSPRALLARLGSALAPPPTPAPVADLSRAVPAPALVAHEKRRSPPARKRHASVPTPLRAQLPEVAKGEGAAGRAYGDHKLMAKRGAGGGVGGGAGGSGSGGAAPSLLRSLALRYLHFVTCGTLLLLAALAATLALEKAGLLTANYNLLGQEACSSSSSSSSSDDSSGEAAGEACQWTWRSGGGGGETGGPTVLLFRALFLHPAVALEYLLSIALPLIPPSDYFVLPAGFLARASGILEGAYFMGLVYGAVTVS
jgi:hypothetical protein